MSSLTPKTPLSGNLCVFESLRISEHVGSELVSLTFVQGDEKKAKTLFKKHWKTPPPEPGHFVNIPGGHALWTGPDQYFLLLDGENIDADRDIAAQFKETAYTTLQTDGWAMVNVIGETVHDALERFIPLDLRRKPAGFSARTNAHHMAIIVIKFGETDYRLLTPRSSARSFFEALNETAESGLS